MECEYVAGEWFDATRQIRFSPGTQGYCRFDAQYTCFCAKRMMQLGDGFILPKNSSKDEMIRAIRSQQWQKSISRGSEEYPKVLEDEICRQADMNALSRRELDIIQPIKQGNAHPKK